MSKLSDHPRNFDLINKNNGEIVKFKDLPVVCQNSMIHYMSVDGAAWAVDEDWDDWKWGEGTPWAADLRVEMLLDIEKFRPRFVERWGDVEFGIVKVLASDLIKCIEQDEYFSENSKTYYQKSVSARINEGWEYEKPTWPVILSPRPEETLQDGWKRFQRYCRLGVKRITCLYYPD